MLPIQFRRNNILNHTRLSQKQLSLMQLCLALKLKSDP